jgi:hypothetical protein
MAAPHAGDRPRGPRIWQEGEVLKGVRLAPAVVGTYLSTIGQSSRSSGGSCLTLLAARALQLLQPQQGERY